MKFMKHLYRRLAVTNLRSNQQFYLPYILVGILSSMLFYAMRAIQGNEGVSNIRGSETLGIVLTMGLVIVGICVCIFLFYTNSFIMKRRRKELGMFHILGMEKKHIIWVLLWEALILYAVSVIGGLAVGIVVSKLLTMFLYQLTGLSESIPFYISWWGCLQTAELFGIMYLILLLYNFMQVKLANPIALLHSRNVGEREPKAKWLFAVTGIGCILVGYYFAANVSGLIEAINMFFIAVILVIAGTYGLFMAGSIAFLKLLRKNKQYYYRTKHFITVSGMLYRMKQNAVGLANICILSTMVMVIISTTVCMYAGLEDALAKSKELNLSFYYKEYPTQEQRNYLQEQMQQIVTAQGRKMTDMSEYSYIPYIIHSEGNTIDIFQRDAGYSNTDMGMIRVFLKEDYEKYLGCSLPEDADGMAFINSSQRIEGTSVQLFGQSWQVQDITELVKGKLDNDEQYSQMVEDMIDFVVADMEAVKQIDQSAGGKYDITYEITANIDGTKEEKKQCAEALKTQMDDCGEQGGYDARMLICTADQREMYLELNGGFLFLGLFLGTMFLMITVLIIYYKQISEGYEDRERFAIMTKVGMSSSEVKAAIRSQVRTIFFLPITVAVMHLVAAFPMLKLMLLLFNIKNTVLFIWCLAGTVVVFFILYFTVFKLTSRRYYQIVYQ